MALSIGIQLFSLREELEKDARGILTALSEMGYNGIEPYGDTYEMSISEFGEFAKSLGLEIPSIHYSLDSYKNRGEELFSEYSKIGTKFATIPYLPLDCHPGGENYQKTVEEIVKCSNHAKEYGIQMLYHNHEHEFKKIDGQYALEKLYEDVGTFLLKAEYDTGWINFAGEDPANYLMKNAARCEVIHLKDLYVRRGTEVERPEFRPVGYGNQDIPALLDAAKDTEAAWIIVEQDSPSLGFNNLECAKMSIEYLKTLQK